MANAYDKKTGRYVSLGKFPAARTKATLCNIWINMGNDNPYTEIKTRDLADKIASKFSIPIHGKKSSPLDVIFWVRENSPELLLTAKGRREIKASQSSSIGKPERFKSEVKRCKCCGSVLSKQQKQGY